MCISFLCVTKKLQKNSFEKVDSYTKKSLEKVDGLEQKSLEKVADFVRYHVNLAIKLGDYNIGRTGQILTLPLYMAFLLREV